MNPLHLLWIIPLTMVATAAAIIFIAVVIVGKEAEEAWNAAHGIKEEDYASGNF